MDGIINRPQKTGISRVKIKIFFFFFFFLRLEKEMDRTAGIETRQAD